MCSSLEKRITRGDVGTEMRAARRSTNDLENVGYEAASHVLRDAGNFRWRLFRRKRLRTA